MIERRSAARFLALTVAGLAVAGTAAATPVPAPTQAVALSGSLHLTAEAPVAIQPILVEADLGDVDQVTIEATVRSLPADGVVLASVAAADRTVAEPRRPAATIAPMTRAVEVVSTSTFPFACPARPCAGSYVLILSWLQAPAGAVADVAWSATATARFRAATGGASAAPGRITVQADGSAARPPAASRLSTVTAGKPVHLTETDRFRAWTLAVHRDAPAGAGGSARTVAQARLAATADRTVGEPFVSGVTKDRRVELRRDPAIEMRILTEGGRPVSRWAGDGDVTFDPFADCGPDAACDQQLTIELAWSDGRPEAAYDVTWSLDLAAVALAGQVQEITTKVAPLDVPSLVAASASGSFDVGGATARGQTNLVLTGGPVVEANSSWIGLGLPARATVTAHLTSLGPTALPPDAIVEIVLLGESSATAMHLQTRAEVAPGGSATLAVEPTLLCSSAYPATCTVRPAIAGHLTSASGAALPTDARIRVDWTMDVGLAVAAKPGIQVAVDPLPSAGPSVRP